MNFIIWIFCNNTRFKERRTSNERTGFWNTRPGHNRNESSWFLLCIRNFISHVQF